MGGDVLMGRNVIDPIKIAGLRELQKALKDIDGESQKMLRTALNKAAEIVVDEARPKVPTRSGKAKTSMRVMSSQREAKVVGGSAKVPYFGWLDYGGKVGRNKSVVRPFISAGRYLYPAYDRNRSRVYDAMVEAITDVATKAGLEID